MARWRQLIVDSGAVLRIEQLIGDRVTAALHRIGPGLPALVRDALGELAVRCTDRAGSDADDRGHGPTT